MWHESSSGQVNVARHGDVAANHTFAHRPAVHTLLVLSLHVEVVLLTLLLKHDSAKKDKENATTVSFEAILLSVLIRFTLPV